MKLLGDFHTHYFKGDIWNNVKTICMNSLHFGFNTVFLGCHNHIGEWRISKKIERIFCLNVIRGAEINTDGGHLLVYNLKELPSELKENSYGRVHVFEMISLAHKLGARVVLAHPFNEEYPSRGSIKPEIPPEEVLPYCDGAELRNYRALIVDGVAEFTYVKNYPHLKLFTSSDFHPWEKYSAISPLYFTEVEKEWFNG